MSDSRKKTQIANEVRPVIIHLNRLDGLDLSHGSPNDPDRREKWKKDVEGFLNKIRERIMKLKIQKTLQQILSDEKDWSKQQYEEFIQRLESNGIDIEGL